MFAEYLTPHLVHNKEEFSSIFEGRGSFWFSSFSYNLSMQEAQGKGFIIFLFYFL